MKQFNFEDRKNLEALLAKGYSITKISNILGKHRNTIYREIKNNSDGDKYDASIADKKSSESMKRRRKDSTKVKKDNETLDYVSNEILVKKKSVNTIANELKDSNFATLSRNTIYSYIDKGMIKGVSRETLKDNLTKMFSNGLIRLPNHVKEKTNFSDGDLVEIVIVNEDEIILKRVK